MKIAVAVPAHDKVDMLFTYDLAQLMAFTVNALPDDWEIGLLTTVGTYIHEARRDLMEAAVMDGAEYVLWLDSDMRFPPDTFIRLLGHEKDFVGINYSQRTADSPDFVAVKYVPEKEGELGQKCVTKISSEGLEEVHAVGFGAFLMRTRALERMPNMDDTPWFWYAQRWPGDHLGEDVYFCRMVRQHCEKKIYVDHDLSHDCAHIGTFEFRTAHVQARMAMEEGA